MASASPTVPGRRSTKQRAAVASLLEQLDEFRSAQDLHEELRTRGEGIGLTTVYRTLQSLADAGEIDVLRIGSGEAVYRRCSRHHHHHLVCRRLRPHRRGRGPRGGEVGGEGGRGERLLGDQPHRRGLRHLRGLHPLEPGACAESRAPRPRVCRARPGAVASLERAYRRGLRPLPRDHARVPAGAVLQRPLSVSRSPRAPGRTASRTPRPTRGCPAATSRSSPRRSTPCSIAACAARRCPSRNATRSVSRDLAVRASDVRVRGAVLRDVQRQPRVLARAAAAAARSARPAATSQPISVRGVAGSAGTARPPRRPTPTAPAGSRRRRRHQVARGSSSRRAGRSARRSPPGRRRAPASGRPYGARSASTSAGYPPRSTGSRKIRFCRPSTRRAASTSARPSRRRRAPGTGSA